MHNVLHSILKNNAISGWFQRDLRRILKFCFLWWRQPLISCQTATQWMFISGVWNYHNRDWNEMKYKFQRYSCFERFVYLNIPVDVNSSYLHSQSQIKCFNLCYILSIIGLNYWILQFIIFSWTTTTAKS